MKTVYFIDKNGILQSKINCKDDSFYVGDFYVKVDLPKIQLKEHETFKFDRSKLSWSVVSFALTEEELSEQNNIELQKSTRKKRDYLLSTSDWTQLPDVPESPRLKWQEYRQALRDIPDQPGFPENIVWPQPPQ